MSESPPQNDGPEADHCPGGKFLHIKSTFQKHTRCKKNMATNSSLRFKKWAQEGELSMDHFDVVNETLPGLKDGEVDRGEAQVFLNNHS